MTHFLQIRQEIRRQTKAGKGQQGTRENFRRRRFPYRSSPVLLGVSSPSRRMEIFNLTLRLRRDTLPAPLSSGVLHLASCTVSEKDGSV